MKIQQAPFVIPLILIALMLPLTACSDDSTSSELDDPPSLPSTMAPVLINTQYFQDQSIPDDEEHSAYKRVEAMVTLGSATFNAEGTMGMVNSFLSLAPMLNVTPEQIDGSWVWEFNVSGFLKEFEHLNQTSSNQTIVTIIATPSGNGYEWQVLYTGLLGTIGVEDFALIRGFTTADYSSGEWRFYDPEGDNSPMATYNWEIVNEAEKNVLLTINQFGEFSEINISYSVQMAEHFLNFESADGTYTRAYWNTDTNSGWFEDFQTSRICYTNFVNSDCS